LLWHAPKTIHTVQSVLAVVSQFEIGLAYLVSHRLMALSHKLAEYATIANIQTTMTANTTHNPADTQRSASE